MVVSLVVLVLFWLTNGPGGDPTGTGRNPRPAVLVQIRPGIVLSGSVCRLLAAYDPPSSWIAGSP